MHVRVGQAPLYMEMLDSSPPRVERDLVNILNIYLRPERPDVGVTIISQSKISKLRSVLYLAH